MSEGDGPWLTWLCDRCKAPAMAVEPGSAEVRERFLLDAGAKPKCWCRDCWLERFGKDAAA